MIPFPDKKYKIIYADPPWEYGNFSNIADNRNRLIKGHKFKTTPYKAMKLEDIKSLPIQDLSDKNSVLIMWLTFPTIPEGLEVINAWGFKYTTILFTWVKRNRFNNQYFTGLGNYTRANAEICAVAKKGFGCKIKSHTVRQVIDTPMTEHSKKPNIARDRIIELFGDLPRIELFARTKVHGWDVWGNDPNLQTNTLEDFNSLQ